jgi:hypothetical protein
MRKSRRSKRKRRTRSSSNNNNIINNKTRVLQNKFPYFIPVKQRILAICGDKVSGWTGALLASTVSRLAQDPPSCPFKGCSPGHEVTVT